VLLCRWSQQIECVEVFVTVAPVSLWEIRTLF